MTTNQLPRRRDTEATRKRMIEAWLAIRAEGVLRPSGVQVAKRAGVTRGNTLYHHFGSVDELALAAIELSLHRQGIVNLEQLDVRFRGVCGQIRRQTTYLMGWNGDVPIALARHCTELTALVAELGELAAVRARWDQ